MSTALLVSLLGLAGLTQVAIWIILAVVFLGRSAFGLDKSIVNFLTFELAIYFIIFFIIGYFMYSILFSIVGASVNTDQEAQQMQWPVTALLVIPMIFMQMILSDPDSTLSVILWPERLLGKSAGSGAS